MNTEQAITKIKELYLNESVKLHRDEDMIALYDEIINIAKEANLEAYKLCFEGYKASIKGEYENAIVFFNQAIAFDDKFFYPWIGLGNIYFEKEDFDEAIKNYKKAIELDIANATPKYNLGLVYTEKKEFNEAIKYFREAIELDDENVYQWNDLGNAYLEKKDYDEAINCYNKAIQLDNKFSYSWYGMGNVYWEKNNYYEAIKNFEKAIELDDKFSDSWYGVGNVYFKTKVYDKAIEYYKQAIERDKLDPQPKELLEKTENLNEIADNVKKLVDRNDKIGIILNRTAPIFEYSEIKKREFLDFLIENKNSPDDSEHYLEVLRRWNSYTPIVANDYHISKGGGYFIKAGGCGIVIDPGFNFIDNFKGAGHKFYEIDVVIISHAHNDHTADLESILTLLYKYNDNIKKSDDPINNDSIFRKIQNRRIGTEHENKEITNEEINTEFEKSGRHKTIDIFMPQSVFKKYGGLIELFKRADYRLHIIEKGRTDIELRSYCKLKIDVLGATHHDIISDCSSVGMVLHTEKSAIVYTGDTGWNTEIEEEYKQASTKIKDKNKKSILIAHLGGFKERENEYAKYVLENDFSNIENSYYKNHLGRIGVAKVVETVEPELCLISEFGEEFKGRRQEIARIYNEAFKEQNTKFLPADIGLVYHLEDSTDDKKNKIKAINKIDIDNYNPLEKDYDFVDIEDIETILLREDYSLHYYAERLVKPEELIQILQKEYRDSIK